MVSIATIIPDVTLPAAWPLALFGYKMQNWKGI